MGTDLVLALLSESGDVLGLRAGIAVQPQGWRNDFCGSTGCDVTHSITAWSFFFVSAVYSSGWLQSSIGSTCNTIDMVSATDWDQMAHAPIRLIRKRRRRIQVKVVDIRESLDCLTHQPKARCSDRASLFLSLLHALVLA